MKMLKFTNRWHGKEGDPLYINKDWIAAVYENHLEGGSLTTAIFGGPHHTEWHVEESLKEVIEIIEGAE